MILWNEHNGVGIITIDALGKNALSLEDLRSFIEIIEMHEQTIKGLIVTGKNHSFCSGLSLKDNQFVDAFPLLDQLLLKLYGLEVPIVCAITGHAIGAGFLIMCCADMVYATSSSRSKFGLPEVKLNLGIDDLMMEILRERLNQTQIRKLLLTGEYVSLSSLLNWGTIDGVFDTDEEMIDKAVAFVDEMIACHSSYLFAKRLLKREKYTKMCELVLRECWNQLTKHIMREKSEYASPSKDRCE